MGLEGEITNEVREKLRSELYMISGPRIVELFGERGDDEEESQ